MRILALALAFFPIAACTAPPPAEKHPANPDAFEPAPKHAEETPTSTVDLARESTLIEESEAALKASDYATARGKAVEAVTSLLARPEGEQDAAWLELLNAAGRSAWDAQDTGTANASWKRVYEQHVAALPDEHTALQVARLNLGMTIRTLGDPTGARALEEKALEVYSRTLPDDHPDLQRARHNLAATLCELGDLKGARELCERVFEVRSRTLPDDHPHLQATRMNLAVLTKELGDLPRARLLEEKVLAVRSRTLPDSHPALQDARQNLAVTFLQLGELASARALFEQVLEVRVRTLPELHPDLQAAQLNLAVTLSTIGELTGARELADTVLEIRSRTLPDDHAELQLARLALANVLNRLGDLPRARELFEKVLEVDSRTLPDDHPDLLAARQNLAATLRELGDLPGARALEEKVLEVRSRTLPDDHLDVQAARQNLAVSIRLLGDLAGARALEERVLAVRSLALPDDHPDLQFARQNLAITLSAFGDLPGARALEEKVLKVYSTTLPDDHPEVQRARQNLAVTIICEQARNPLEGADVRRQRCAELFGALVRTATLFAHDAVFSSSSREAEERCAQFDKPLSKLLSFANGYGVFQPLHRLDSDSFEFAETMRGAAIVAAHLTRSGRESPKYGDLREALRRASDELAGIAQQGTTSGEFDRARVNRESVERELVALARNLVGWNARDMEFTVDSLASGLAVGEAAVGIRRYTMFSVSVGEELDHSGQPAVHETSIESLCAFVVRGGAPDAAGGSSSLLTLVDLGPIAPIERAVGMWREAVGAAGGRGLGVSASGAPAVVRFPGESLRKLVFDPLLPVLGDAHHVVLALDDVLHLVPIDSLPLDDGTLIGDRWEIETRATLSELLMTPEPIGAAGPLVAFGDVDYGSPTSTNPADTPAELGPRSDDAAGILRGTEWSGGFAALPATRIEVQGIERTFRDATGTEGAVELHAQADASRDRLLELAPKARYLHIATHGWFAPESIRSWNDPEPLDKHSGLGQRPSGEEQVRGMSPMLLCGLALAGANLPEDAVGRAPGLVTADEISSWDLSNCELAVLSACDTNVGERRAGQGVASLQKALQMAGARSVITSLWKVPDEATKELMLDFYRRLWVEKKPKWQALWEAKMKLRNAKDAEGRPIYSTRDWAAWVLTGEPD